MNILHDFYIGGLSKDIRVVPTPATAMLIKNARLRFREVPKGYAVVYRAIDDSGTPYLDMNEDLRFTFALFAGADPKVTLNEFLKFTNFDESPSKPYRSGNVIFFKDTGTGGLLDYELLDAIRPEIFTYSFNLSTAGAVDLKVLDENAVEVIEELDLVDDGNDNYRVPVDFSKLPKGKYTFQQIVDDVVDAEQEIYIDGQLYTQNVFGVLQIDLANEDLYSTAEEFDMQFTRKESEWTYYIVNQSGKVDLDDYTFEIEDVSGDNSNPSNPYAEYTFTSGASPDPVVKINGFDTVVFTSDQNDIPFYELPKLALNLKRVEIIDITGPDEVVLKENLENPPLNKGVTSEIFVFV